MKPKHLKFPYLWEERKPQIVEGVLFIPEYYDQHRAFNFPSWETVFGNDRPVTIEFCTGNGTWLAKKAEDNLRNWVAVEWDFERVRKIWSKMKNDSLSNLFIVCGEAQVFARDYLPEASVDEIYVNFPDPWPKEKHAKHRLFQAPFTLQLARILRPRGKVTVVTDDATYGEQILKEFLDSNLWNSSFVNPYFITEWEGYGTSYFDTLWRGKGKTIRYFQFEKI
jgi:tRNA (guanine-N7-)-methyltransferase